MSDCVCVFYVCVTVCDCVCVCVYNVCVCCFVRVLVEQQRAREVVEWRIYEEEQQKLQEEQSVIELKQKLHLEEYKKERAGLTHLSWKQRKSALYRANKSKFAVRASERTQRDELSLPLIIKGTPLRSDRLLPL